MGLATRAMETNRFCFELPPELIAQRPLAQRSAARLMVLERAGGALQHLRVRDLPGCCNPARCWC